MCNCVARSNVCMELHFECRPLSETGLRYERVIISYTQSPIVYPLADRAPQFLHFKHKGRANLIFLFIGLKKGKRKNYK